MIIIDINGWTHERDWVKPPAATDPAQTTCLAQGVAHAWLDDFRFATKISGAYQGKSAPIEPVEQKLTQE